MRPPAILPQEFIDHLPLGVLVLDRAQRVRQYNTWMQERTPERLRLGEINRGIFLPQSLAIFEEAVQRAFSAEATVVLAPIPHQAIFALRPTRRPPEGPVHAQSVYLFPLRRGRRTWVVVLVEDLSPEAAMEQHLKRRLAIYQALYQIVSRMNALEEASVAESLGHLHRFLEAAHTMLYLNGDHHAPTLAAYYGEWEGAPSLPSHPPEGSLVQEVLTTRRSRLWQAQEGPPPGQGRPLDPETRSAMAVPLLSGATLFGVLAVESRREGAFGQDDLHLLLTVADRLALGLQLARSYARERRLRRLAEVLRETGMQLAAELDPNRVQDLILSFVQKVVPYDSACVLTVSPEGLLRVSRHRGYERFGIPKAALDHLEIPLEALPNLHRMSKTFQPMVIPDTSQDPSWVALETSGHVQSWVGAPIVTQGRLLGFLTLDHSQPHFYTAEHAQALALFATQAALALENARQYEARYYQAVTDALTGLANRRHLHTELEREVARALRFRRPLSLLMIDLDDFKRYNDAYGHPAGDQALQAVAQVLRSLIRKVDIAARYGGEEFTVVLPEADINAARQVGERIRSTVAALHRQPGQALQAPVTVSVGVATLPQHAQNERDLIVAADTALYQAKQQGKNCVAVYAPEPSR